MNLDDSLDEAAFRQAARSWIAANAPTHLEADLARSPFDSVALSRGDALAAAKDWQAKKAAAGWACLQWPRDYGGRGATAMERVIWDQEEGVYAKLTAMFTIGHGMCGPTLMAYAGEAQKRRFLPPLAAGREFWCQMFSEPGAGSDLAGLRLRAERAGDDWVLEGQKIWTSGAHHADYGIVLTRTDPTVPKHAGLTMFFVDMRTPGIAVRPIRQANGLHGFNEVFFAGVRVPDEQRLGPPGGGWRVSLTTLMNERLSIGAAMPTGFPELLALCRSEIDGRRPIDDPAVRTRLAGWAVRASGLKYTAYRGLSALANGQTPGPENSIGKLVAASTMQEIAAFALDLQGAAGVVADPALAPAGGLFQAMLLRAAATRIEGGSDEILRNIIAERVLGLPPGERADKDVPFNQLDRLAAPGPRAMR
ncbi:MAG: acyl-CoA dehydrogenase family protein [Rhodospirillaceae bacterium]|nr:acyl-CoA dehydrogenase family protein [Rhodospirillaceae bacterium]